VPFRFVAPFAPASPRTRPPFPTAPYRDDGWAGVGVDPDPANAGLITRFAQDYWRDLHPPRPAAATSTS